MTPAMRKNVAHTRQNGKFQNMAALENDDYEWKSQ